MKRLGQDRHRPARQSLPTLDRRVTRSTKWARRIPDSDRSNVVGRVLAVAVELTLMLPRAVLERFVDQVIERLDAEDGDPDSEAIDEREPESFM